ncbi:MAG: SpoIVB peptidase [Bacilli bacterium]|nr:SpoIVB peptidase [Bacilli bacterium]
MKKNKLLTIIWLLIVTIIPINVLAYSDFIIPGGENVGIEVSSNGVLVVGFYEVDNKLIAKDSGFMLGDRIIKVNNKDVNSIDDMVNVVKESDNEMVNYTIIRDNKEINLKASRNNQEGVYKTGIYVKDSIQGIGTLTFIDPETLKFGALGHEILEKTTSKKFEIKDGKIFKSDVTSINKSEDGKAGEKNARYDKTEVYGDITENTTSGIFGNYTAELPNEEKIKVGTENDIHLGEAKIRTVINKDEIKEFKINIIKLNPNSDTKNILFEIVDEKLLENTGGVVQGMSGSPIIQDDKIVGAVTHVIVNDSKKGYGIFITKMLKEADN